MTGRDESSDFDVIVVGGGNAALCVAVAARRDGARVLVLEQAAKFNRWGQHTPYAPSLKPFMPSRCPLVRSEKISDPTRARELDPAPLKKTVADFNLPVRPSTFENTILDDCRTDGLTLARQRRLAHHLTSYGFLLCFASTSLATAYHYLFGLEAPYPWCDVPVLLGVAGGFGLVAGSAEPLAEKLRRDPDFREGAPFGMDADYLAMPFLAGLTGLALLVFRATSAMGSLLTVHVALVRSVQERQTDILEINP